MTRSDLSTFTPSKWASLGMALVAVLCLTACGRGNTAEASPGTVFAPAFGFTVEIDGEPSPDRWSSVDGLGLVVGRTDVADARGGGTSSSPTGRSPTTLRLTLPFGEGPIPGIKQWVQDTYDGKDVRKTLRIQITGPDGRTVRTFDCFECFPTRFELSGPDGNAGALMSWTLEVRVNRIEMA